MSSLECTCTKAQLRSFFRRCHQTTQHKMIVSIAVWRVAHLHSSCLLGLQHKSVSAALVATQHVKSCLNGSAILMHQASHGTVGACSDVLHRLFSFAPCGEKKTRATTLTQSFAEKKILRTNTIQDTTKVFKQIKEKANG
eukprot:5480290-Amphidinium_carterae.1